MIGVVPKIEEEIDNQLELEKGKRTVVRSKKS